MKFFYLLLILMLSVSLTNAQSFEAKEPQSDVPLTQSSAVVFNNNGVIKPSKREKKIIRKEKKILRRKTRIARRTSAISIYFSRERKVENIELLFPKIIKEKNV